MKEKFKSAELQFPNYLLRQPLTEALLYVLPELLNPSVPEEQIASAQTMIQNGVDYLILSAAGTAGWETVLQAAKDNGVKVFISSSNIMSAFAVHIIF